MIRISSIIAVTTGGFCLGAATLTFAQTGPSSRTTARISSQIEVNDNYDLQENSPGNSLIWDNIFGFTLEGATPVDSFLANVQGTARGSDLPELGRDFTFDNPRALLSFIRAVDDSNMNFNLTYRRADLDFFDPLTDIDPDGSFEASNSGGTRSQLRTSFGAEINESGPLSLDLNGYYSNRQFTDTTDPTLEDKITYGFSSEVGARVTPTLTATVGADGGFEDIGDDVNTTKRRALADLGFDAEVNERMTASARVGYSEVQTERDTGDETTQGFVGSLSFQVDQMTGNTRGRIGSRLDENGERLDITGGRLVEWRNGSLNFNLGASTSDSTEWRPIGTVAYVYQLPRSEIGANLSQATTVDDESRNVVNSSASVNFLQQLTPISSVDFRLLGGLTQYDDQTRRDSTRTTFSATYNRDLTQDWAMNFGYRYRYLDSETASEASSNAVFLGISRSFVTLR